MIRNCVMFGDWCDVTDSANFICWSLFIRKPSLIPPNCILLTDCLSGVKYAEAGVSQGM